MKNSLPLVSVVITTKNNSRTLNQCLESIRDQTYKNIEIIVVDNSSTDNTKEIAKKYTRLIFNKGPERSTQRNFAGKIAKGKYLLILDADFILSKNIIKECVNKINKNANLLGLYIPLRWVAQHWIIKAKGFEREFYDGTCLDAIRFVEKKAFIKIKGYDPRLYAAEDWDFDKKIRNIGNVALINSIMYHHEDNNLNLKQYLKKMSYYSDNLNLYINTWGKNDLDIKKQFSLYYRYFKVFIENGKWKKVLSHPLKFINMYLLKIIVGFVFLLRKRSSNKHYASNNFPSLSFIIPTYNSESTLPNCLNGIKNQDYPKDKVTIIITDGGSNDKTIEIAKRFSCQILENKKIIAEYGKAIGIKKSKSDYFILLDSDNIIKDNNWLKKMVYPMQKEKDIMGVESQFGVEKSMGYLDRYSARMRITDPLARMLIAHNKKIKKDGYSLLIYKTGERIASGANGFLWNKELVDKFWDKGEVFEEANFCTHLSEKGYCSYAVPNDTYVYHYHINKLTDFIKKRKKIASKFLERQSKRKTWLDNVSKVRLFFLALYLGSFIGPSIEGLYKTTRDRDTCWLIHPITSFLTIWIYSMNYLNFDKKAVK